MSAIAAIHVAKRDLGLEEDDYRALLQRVTGKASLKVMTAGEHGRVLDELRSKGAPKKGLTGPYAKKLQALWISGWNLGIVRDRRDSAMLAFVKRQTGIEHTRFLRDAADARKAVEALKGWLTRAGKVDWSEDDDPTECVIRAQCRMLGKPRSDVGIAHVNGTMTPALATIAGAALMQILGAEIRKSGIARK